VDGRPVRCGPAVEVGLVRVVRGAVAVLVPVGYAVAVGVRTQQAA
jgi:hypothetical protein